MEIPPAGTGSQAQFNAGYLSVQRLNEVLRNCNHYASQGQLTEWWQWLQVLNREVSTKLSDKEIEETNKLRGQVIEALNEHGKAQHNNINLEKAEGKLWFFLDKLDVWLRRKADLRGLLVPDRKDPSFAVGEGY